MSETLESLRGSFNRSLRVEGKADRTLVLYGQSIDYFSRWLAEQGLQADLSTLTRDNVLGWLDALRARGLTTGTIRTRWRGLRRFVNWLVAEDILAKDPLAGIVVDKPEAPPVPILTDGDLTALLNTCLGSRASGTRVRLERGQPNPSVDSRANPQSLCAAIQLQPDSLRSERSWRTNFACHY